FQPVHVVGALAHGGLWPMTVCTTWVPAARAMPLASGPHGTAWSSPPSSALVLEPVIATEIGFPSMVRRLLTQLPGTAAGVGGKVTPGMPISAMPSGRASGPAE